MQRASAAVMRYVPLCPASSSFRAFNTANEGARHLDKIHLKGLCFHGYHGVIPEENKLGQKFLVDATLFCDLRKACASDELPDTINYAEVYSHVQRIIEGPPFKLLEAAAEQVARTVLSSDLRVEGVQVHLRKPHVAVTGVLDSLGVEILRWRKDMQQ